MTPLPLRPDGTAGHWPPKLFYLFYFMALSCVSPYMPLIYEMRGMNGRQIGLLIAIPYLAGPLAGPLWGMLGDSTRRHRDVLMLTLAGTWLAVLGLMFSYSFALMLPLAALYAWFNTPIIPYADHSAMEVLGERRDQYGKIRIWGTVGWGVFSLVIGWLIARHGIDMAFGGYLVMLLLAGGVAWHMPLASVKMGAPIWKSLRVLAADPIWLRFLLGVALGGFGMTLAHMYLFIRLHELGATGVMMGWAMVINTLSEFVFMFFSARLLRLGARRLFNVSLVLLLFRLILLSVATDSGFILVTQMLHGCTFATLWLAGVSFAHRMAPPGLGATAQGVFAGTWSGVGGALGALLGGYALQLHGAQAIYRWGAWAMAAGLLVYLATYFMVRRQLQSAEAETLPPH